MVNLAIIGFGNHVVKNILPALNKIADVEIEAIYVRDLKRYKNKALEQNVSIRLVSDLSETKSHWVYISTPISTHYELVKQALMLGKNVVCEKIITNHYDACLELFKLATQQNCQLYEVCMYTYHKQFEYLAKVVKENQDRIKRVSATFSIPHLDKNDIRYKNELGGGALLDVGYYPVSIMVNLFGLPDDIQYVKNTESGYEVDLNGVAIFHYNNFYAVVEWGIGLPYSNEFVVTLPDEKYSFNRVFAKPSTFPATVEIIRGTDSEILTIGSDDHFLNMFTFFFSGLNHVTSKRTSTFQESKTSQINKIITSIL
jgi:NDP-hexose-3-ketoreductase